MIILGDALEAVKDLSDVRLLWTDPPYGTGKVQKQGDNEFYDPFDTSYVLNVLKACLPAMNENGTIVVCCDYRLATDLTSFMQDCWWTYRGEIIWEFGLGRPRTSWWPVRHNNLLTFTKTEESGLFDGSAVPRAKRLAPKPGYSEDKPSGSVWDFTMSNTHPDRVGYPNQKPIEIIEPFVLAHTLPGDLVLDPFCGSGSTGAAALKHGRRFVGIDVSSSAVEVSKKRLDI
jgi:site-specific DNA-methyltransferase (adenine-specific)